MRTRPHPAVPYRPPVLTDAEADEIRPEDLPARLRGDNNGSGGPLQAGWVDGSFRDAKVQFERAYFREVLERADGSISAAARLAGIHRATFHEKIKRLGLANEK